MNLAQETLKFIVDNPLHTRSVDERCKEAVTLMRVHRLKSFNVAPREELFAATQQWFEDNGFTVVVEGKHQVKSLTISCEEEEIIL